MSTVPESQIGQFVDAPKCRFVNVVIRRIKELDVNEDCEKLDQKIIVIFDTLKMNCETMEEVEKIVGILYQFCLSDEDLGNKFTSMVASMMFTTQKILDVNIRLEFLRHLQASFCDRRYLQITDPRVFRRCVQILSDFFNKASLISGEKLDFLVPCLILYMEMLLDSSKAEDLQLFTTLLYSNGPFIKSEYPCVLSDLLDSARLKLVSEFTSDKRGKLWMLLALDVSSASFGMLSDERFEFYLQHLDHSVLAKFQGEPTNLGILCVPSAFLADYSSEENVLLICKSKIPTEENIIDTLEKLSTRLANSVLEEETSSSGFSSDAYSQESSDMSIMDGKISQTEDRLPKYRK